MTAHPGSTGPRQVARRVPPPGPRRPAKPLFPLDAVGVACILATERDILATERLDPGLPMPPDQLRLKHASRDPAPDDGARVLVDRRWPTDLPRQDADLTLWLHSAAPSEELRAWYDDDVDRWKEFRRRYRRELEDREEELNRLEQLAEGARLTLVHASGTEARSPAAVLKERLEKRMDGAD